MKMNCVILLFFSLLFVAINIQRSATLTPELQNSSYWKDNTVLSDHNSAALYSPSSSFCVGNQSNQCPSWAYCNKTDGTCKCFRKSTDAIICDSEGNHGFILSCYCLTHDAVMNKIEVGLCLYNCDYMGKNINVDYSLLPYNESSLDYVMCGIYNRTGTLCGKCINNTYLQAYSYDMSCITCGNSFSNLIKYFIVAYVPLTLFCIAVMILRISIPSSQIQGYVFFCQILSSPIFLRNIFIYMRVRGNSAPFKIIMQLFGTLYGIWNLDFFRLLTLDICFEVSPLTVLSLDFFVAVYPLLLMILMYILTLLHDSNFKPVVKISKPIKAIFSLFVSNWDVKTSTIDAFTTFFYLSNIKFLSVCFDLLVPVQVCDTSVNGSCKWAVFYDATVPYLSNEHIPYAVLAMFIMLQFVMAPILILIIYPFALCQKCLSLIPRRWQLALHMFVDSFQGCYKDGTDPGTRDCRWFSVVPFLVRYIIFIVYGAIVLSSFLMFFIMILVFTASLTIIVDPYKSQFKHYSNYLIIYILMLACVVTCAQGLDYGSSVIVLFYVVMCLIGLLHLVYMSVLVLNWIISHRKFNFNFIKKCCTK